jgi:group I intron endonuclease
MAFEVYCITNLANGKKYVGVTANGYANRFANHIWHSRKSKSSCRALHNAMRKYGPNSFSVELLQAAESWEHMNQLEKEWIKKLGTFSPNGYNLTDGGDAGSFSDETRRIMSDRFKGKPISEKTIAAVKASWDDPASRDVRIASIREAMNRPDVREATGARQRGKPKSDNHVKALRTARAKPVLCVETGQLFDAIVDAVRWIAETQSRPTANHSKILRAIKSDNHTAYGYRWRYANT